MVGYLDSWCSSGYPCAPRTLGVLPATPREPPSHTLSSPSEGSEAAHGQLYVQTVDQVQRFEHLRGPGGCGRRGPGPGMDRGVLRRMRLARFGAILDRLDTCPARAAPARRGPAKGATFPLRR